MSKWVKKMNEEEKKRISEFLLNHSVSAIDLSKEAAEKFSEQWVRIFAPLVKKEHGVYIHRGYRWHAYSYRLQPCIEGEEAINKYRHQPDSPFYVFNESLSYCALCKADRYPELSGLHTDIYVTHNKMAWTMAFTHEQPQIGPFFAEHRVSQRGD